MDIESLGFAHKYDITGGHENFGEEVYKEIEMFEGWLGYLKRSVMT